MKNNLFFYAQIDQCICRRSSKESVVFGVRTEIRSCSGTNFRSYSRGLAKKQGVKFFDRNKDFSICVSKVRQQIIVRAIIFPLPKDDTPQKAR